MSRIYHSISNVQFSCRKAKQLFDTVEEALEFLEQRCLDGVQAIILLSLRRYAEAVESFVAAGRWVAAIKVLLMTRSSDSTRRACNYILQEFRKLMPFGFRAENATSNPIAELLDLSDQLEKNHLSSTELAEVSLSVSSVNNILHSFTIRLKCSTGYIQIIIQLYVNLARCSSTNIILPHLPAALNNSIKGASPISKQ